MLSEYAARPRSANRANASARKAARVARMGGAKLRAAAGSSESSTDVDSCDFETARAVGGVTSGRSASVITVESKSGAARAGGEIELAKARWIVLIFPTFQHGRVFTQPRLDRRQGAFRTVRYAFPQLRLKPARSIESSSGVSGDDLHRTAPVSLPANARKQTMGPRR